MTKTQITDLAIELADIINDGSAPFTVTFGWVNRIVMNDGVQIHDASHAVLRRLMAWVEKQDSITMLVRKDGILIH